MVTVVNNAMLCTWHLLRESRPLTHKHGNGEVMDVLTTLIVVIILQCIDISHYHVVYLKYI